MTRDEFETAYCERSNITVERYRQIRITLPCGCDFDGCEGWGAVSYDASMLLHHLCFSLPPREKLMELEGVELRSFLEKEKKDPLP